MKLHRPVLISIPLASQVELGTMGILWISLRMLMTAVGRLEMDHAQTLSLDSYGNVQVFLASYKWEQILNRTWGGNLNKISSVYLE